jgi:hypothetical protein
VLTVLKSKATPLLLSVEHLNSDRYTHLRENLSTKHGSLINRTYWTGKVGYYYLLSLLLSGTFHLLSLSCGSN